MKFGTESVAPILFAFYAVPLSAQQAVPASAQSSAESASVVNPTSVVEPAASTGVATAAPCDCVVVPALTTVDIEILALLSSATSKDGDTFPIRLASPIVVEGREVVPAAVTGIGEVIHAQKSGMGGGGGELLLAARYLDVDGRRLRLRSFRAARYGKNQTGAALATSIAFGVFGLAVKGKNTQIAVGTMAEAKVAEAFSIPASALPPPAQSPVAESHMPVPEPIAASVQAEIRP